MTVLPVTNFPETRYKRTKQRQREANRAQWPYKQHDGRYHKCTTDGRAALPRPAGNAALNVSPEFRVQIAEVNESTQPAGNAQYPMERPENQMHLNS